MSELPSPDVFLASAVQFLVEGGENDAATLLLSCSIQLAIEQRENFNGEEWEVVNIGVFGPRAAYDGIRDTWSDTGKAIRAAFEAVLPWDKQSFEVIPRAQLVEADSGWRQELQKVIQGTGVDNQGVPIEGSDIQVWHGLRFRSKTEIKIAQALQGRAVLFFPNCRARLRMEDGFGNREPDFLVCQEGKWGILQVDGEPWHGGHTRAREQNDDRLFHAYGVRVVQHYSANECWNNTNRVIDEFLQFLGMVHFAPGNMVTVRAMRIGNSRLTQLWKPLRPCLNCHQVSEPCQFLRTNG